ncbi:UbiD family decarboxylase [Streptomyces sp. UNOB3_S3]|uniref:UbiD family decarboxylase n=1 Tax=Streptomyces sp. UNOB3_S3 TaxID=2871682 RepID=UPI001E376AA4|nr:UbiD family decarboxylase [Streptomyces sp. UNOB3_S3]MCC3775376.1 UbiD family decarboxylase [Streptomyces sp. UNOB3_S3]
MTALPGLPGLSFRAALAAARKDAPHAHHTYDQPLTRHEIAAHYAARHAGIPATSSSRTEDIALYTRVTDAAAGMPVVLGAFGDAERLRRWLPGLPRRTNDDTIARLLAACQEPEHLESSPFPQVRLGADVDLGELPALWATERDAGPYLTTGLLYAHDPRTGRSATAVHRMLVRDRNQLVIWMLPSRRLLAMYHEAVERGERLPVSVNLGAPPAVMVASAVGSDFLPAGTSKTALAGALAGGPVTTAPAVSQPVPVFAESEVVLEGYFDGTTAPEALPGRATGHSLPEVLGYDGNAAESLPAITVTAVTSREAPVFPAVIGPGREQSLILGLAGAVALGLSWAGGELLRDAHYSPAGGGMFLLVLQVRKSGPGDDERVRAMAKDVLDRHRFAKVVVLVDEDVAPDSAEDVLWAITTRSDLSADALRFTGFPRIGLDPSQGEAWAAARGREATGSRTVVDATVPFALRERHGRSFPGVAHD